MSADNDSKTPSPPADDEGTPASGDGKKRKTSDWVNATTDSLHGLHESIEDIKVGEGGEAGDQRLMGPLALPYRVLTIAENVLIYVLLGGAVLGALSLVLNNWGVIKLQWGALLQPIVRHLVFYVALAGAVVATRNSNHISIDLFGRFFQGRSKHFLHVLLQLFGFGLCLVLAVAAFRYVVTNTFTNCEAYLAGTARGKFLIPTEQRWWCDLVLWKAPFVGFFGLIGLHFLINALLALVRGIKNLPVQEREIGGH